MLNIIVAKMFLDDVEPYKHMNQKIPFVVESDHPRFVVGTQLGWGFVQVALKDGYRVEIIP